MKKLIQKADVIIKGILVFGLFYFSTYFQYIPYYLFHMNKSMIYGNYTMMALFSTFSSLCALFILLIIYRKDLINDFTTFIKDIRNNMDIGFASWATGFVVMLIVNFFLVFVLHSEGADNENAVRELIHAAPIIMGIDICLVAPLAEEIVFRKTLKDIFKNCYLFIFLSFLVFGLAHVMATATTFIDWLYIIPYGVMGGAFAYADYKTDTIFTSVVFHALHNLLLLTIVLTL